MTLSFTRGDVRRIAELAHVPITAEEEQQLADAFTKTMTVVDELTKLDLTEVDEYSPIGLVNQFRPDEVDTSRMFTQEQALSNAKRTHDGYFVVGQVINREP